MKVTVDFKGIYNGKGSGSMIVQDPATFECDSYELRDGFFFFIKGNEKFVTISADRVESIERRR
jgi:hypothetical protein